MGKFLDGENALPPKKIQIQPYSNETNVIPNRTQHFYTHIRE